MAKSQRGEKKTRIRRTGDGFAGGGRERGGLISPRRYFRTTNCLSGEKVSVLLSCFCFAQSSRGER